MFIVDRDIACFVVFLAIFLASSLLQVINTCTSQNITLVKVVDILVDMVYEKVYMRDMNISMHLGMSVSVMLLQSLILCLFCV